MTTLMISPYPPSRDGIATYTAQEVVARMRAGEDIEVLSPTPSAAHRHLVLGGPKGWTRLLRQLDGIDQIVIQLFPELLHGACRNPIERVAAWSTLEAVCRRRPTELRVHEVEYGPAERNPLERRAGARALRAAEVVSVHTEPERQKLCATFGLDVSEVVLVDHGRYFASHANATQDDARIELGLSTTGHVFLAIGFLQAHKGFDRAVRAFAEAGLEGRAELHVVGSVRVDVPEFVAYARSLRRQIDAVPGATFHERFVSDAEFDLWIRAADTVVLPYREIFSSGVLERANLIGRPVIASQVGGLEGQLRKGSQTFGDDHELAAVMRSRAGMAGASDNDPTAAPVARIDPTTEAIERHVRTAMGTDRSQALDLGERLSLPPATSHRPAAAYAKRAVRMVTGWQLQPIVDRINRLEEELNRVLGSQDR
ncbi:MAG: glycosyltransferase [Acidimicrobiales bacterium]